jgi:hypothetical protein
VEQGARGVDAPPGGACEHAANGGLETLFARIARFSTLKSAFWTASLRETGFFAPVSFSITAFSGASFDASQM